MRSTFILSAILAAATLCAASPSAEAGKVKVNIGVGVGFYNPSFGAHAGFGNHHASHHHHAPVFVAPQYCAPVVYRPAPVVYVPAYTFVYEQQWVPPVWQTHVIGYDHCGRPVTQQVCVAQGYSRTLRYRLYSTGAKVFDGYV